MYTKPFRNNLRAHRLNAGLRQTDVARLIGLDCSDRLSHWERGSAVPHILNLFKLAALYKVKPHELYGELYESVNNLRMGCHKNNPVTNTETPYREDLAK